MVVRSTCCNIVGGGVSVGPIRVNMSSSSSSSSSSSALWSLWVLLSLLSLSSPSYNCCRCVYRFRFCCRWCMHKIQLRHFWLPCERYNDFTCLL